MNERLLVVSDVHLCSHDGPPQQMWRSLIDFLQQHMDSVSTLLLDGDCFDFLPLPNRPHHLDLAGAAQFVNREWECLSRDRWGATFFQTLSQWVGKGGQLVLIPGNHDLELYHPQVEEVLHARLQLWDATQKARCRIHRDDAPWQTRIGEWQVSALHGDAVDPWNRVDVTGLQKSLREGKPVHPLPVGSRLVLDHINQFKRAMDPKTGNRRFPFVDHLKPEIPGLLLLLFYLDPILTLTHVSKGLVFHGVQMAYQEIVAAFMRELRGILQGNVLLLSDTPPRDEEEGDGAEVLRLICQTLVHNLPPEVRSAPNRLIRPLEDWLRSPGNELECREGTLGWPNEGKNALLRAAIRALGGGASFFDPSIPVPYDTAIIERHPPRAGSRSILIAGHTHGARFLDRGTNGYYVNTGTWTGLIRLPGENDNLNQWIQALTSQTVETMTRFTFAEITAAGVCLKTWM
ncbi:MAG: metallophosphoesterase [Magnetococcales bacterium]|nr:metallophosphoesterase [Magnetococcales bacterium]MBF0151340.1 metallophosphoesterase [Magnetococcales bacterium]